jgi:IS30 family transposase
MTYHQLTLADRIAISTLGQEGLNASQIAQRLGRHRSTISRELRRNSRPQDGYYRGDEAQSRTNARRRACRRWGKFSDIQWRFVNDRLQEKWSPEQISGQLAYAAGFAISHETIYRHVWRDRHQGGTLHQSLRQSTKQKRKRYRSKDSRGRLGGKRMIDERPAEVEERQVMGHWEADTVLGAADGQACILTLVERVSGLTLIGKLRNRTKEECNRRAIELIRRHSYAFKSITADNGTEFHGYKDIEAATGVPFYFARPYHSWERGTNENTNGLIRQYLPKRKSMTALTQSQCDAIALQLNRRPRKRHGYKTPEAVLYGI